MTELATDFSRMKNLVEDNQPDELPAVVAAEYGGYTAVADAMFDLYQRAFDPERAGDAAGEFQFTLITPDGDLAYLLSVADGACAVRPGTAQDPTVGIRLTLADFLRMSCGETNGAMLAMSGKLEVTGDVLASMNLSDWFVMPESD
jgi:putative sterol carrier protein